MFAVYNAAVKLSDIRLWGKESAHIGILNQGIKNVAFYAMFNARKGLRWLRHVVRMWEDRKPKQELYKLEQRKNRKRIERQYYME